jgi:hypothetical protein
MSGDGEWDLTRRLQFKDARLTFTLLYAGRSECIHPKKYTEGMRPL